MEGLGVDVIGTNCGAGPDEMLSVLKALRSVVSVPLSIMPNAGLPVIENGKTRSKKIDAGNKIWIQNISMSLQCFVKDKTKDKMNFSIIKTDDLSLFDMVALKKKDVDIAVGPGKFKTANVIVTLPGMKSVLWKSNYWFQKNDGLFLKYKGTDGPGTPVTITELVMVSKSKN